MSAQPHYYVFQPNKPKLRKHTKSRKGCLACKARKVKCSETLPACAHCTRLDIECVYPHTPNVLPTPPSDAEQQDSPAIYKTNRDDDSDNTVVKTTPPQSKSLIDCVLPSTIETHEYMAVLESLHFFNNRLLLEITPAHAPFERTLIDVSQWLIAPRVVQLSLIVLTLAVQRSRSCSSPSFDKDVLHYRGTCLTELTALVGDTNVDCQTLAFDCIQLMMLAEMQLEPLGSWSYHLEGTRRLIALQGGLSDLFYQKPALRNLLINYMEVDVLTSATCNVKALDEDSVDAQKDYFSLLGDREAETITTACFMPIPLLQAIAEINKLRMQCSRHNLSPDESFAIANEFSRIHKAISTFDPSHWATRILSYGMVRPQPLSTLPPEEDVDAMTTLALCQQAAATLYLHLCCNPAPQPHFLDTTHEKLTAGLANLLSQASSDTETPLYTQLYKCAVWPLFVAAYVKVGWDVGRSGDDDTEDLDRLSTVAKKIQSRPLAVAVDVLDRVRVERAHRAGIGSPWKWDEAFEGRCSFCVL
ncbi:hypothetical protein MBLNU13_g00182t1 [Cladosporium sp. NU13]